VDPSGVTRVRRGPRRAGVALWLVSAIAISGPRPETVCPSRFRNHGSPPLIQHLKDDDARLVIASISITSSIRQQVREAQSIYAAITDPWP
jgi:hypothetical protein